MQHVVVVGLVVMVVLCEAAISAYQGWMPHASVAWLLAVSSSLSASAAPSAAAAVLCRYWPCATVAAAVVVVVDLVLLQVTCRAFCSY